MNKVASFILALIMVLALFGFDSPLVSASSQPQISATGINDCRTITIKRVTKVFKRLDGTPSRAWEWKRVSPSKLKHVKGPKLRGEVPDNHYVVGKYNPMWNLEGMVIVKKRFTLRCVPDSGTYNTNFPPLACPATADDAHFLYGGRPGNWDVHLEGSTSYLYFSGGVEKLGGFTVSFQSFVMAKKSWNSDDVFFYTPGDTVRPSSLLNMVCWRQRL